MEMNRLTQAYIEAVSIPNKDGIIQPIFHNTFKRAYVIGIGTNNFELGAY